jgi:hypothetical protein
MDGGNVRRSFRVVCRAAGVGPDWTPRELRHTFVSLMSDSDVAVEEIARLVGQQQSHRNGLPAPAPPSPHHWSRENGRLAGGDLVQPVLA